MTNEARFTVVDPAPPPEEEIGLPTVVGRFITRAFCDETGAPNLFLLILPLWLPVAAAFFFLALTIAPSVANSVVAERAVFGMTAITVLLILVAGALLLGAGLFIPLVEAVAGVFTSTFRGARDLVVAGMDRYRGGPDRTVGLTEPGGELFRRSRKAAPVRGGDDPYTDDERDE